MPTFLSVRFFILDCTVCSTWRGLVKLIFLEPSSDKEQTSRIHLARKNLWAEKQSRKVGEREKFLYIAYSPYKFTCVREFSSLADFPRLYLSPQIFPGHMSYNGLFFNKRGLQTSIFINPHQVEHTVQSKIKKFNTQK